MSIPTHPISLMSQVYRKVFPAVHRELAFWTGKAEAIPNHELRAQALASIRHKTFHCEGGSILALLALTERERAIKFIVAYQTISDYLDNLCDRSTSLDPEDFSALHESMKDALTVEAPLRHYYRHRVDQDDGGYLAGLVQTCQSVLKEVPGYSSIKPYLHELCDYYCDLQIHKHVEKAERTDRLKNWFLLHKDTLPEMDWYEFSACSGSTLGIFCLVSYALREDYESVQADSIRNGYFPYIQGLHILLDYFIDQEEDIEGGDLNFCFYYENEEVLKHRLLHFLKKADENTSQLPHADFHRLINKGLIGVYLSDEKAWKQQKVYSFSKEFLNASGWVTKFFYYNGKLYRRFQGWKKSS